MAEHIDREYVIKCMEDSYKNAGISAEAKAKMMRWLNKAPAADVRPVSEIEKIIESLQEQADLYNARAQELLVEEDGQVSQYTWAVSLRETYRRIIKTLDDLIS